MLLTFIQLVFLLLFIHQIVLVLIAWWTGAHSDVPFQSTKKSALHKLLKELNITPQHKIYDLGSGTGRVAFFFAQNTAAQVLGVEKNWFLYSWSQFKKKLFYPQLKVNFLRQDLFNTDLSTADLVYTYFSPRAYKKAQVKFEQEVRPGATFIAWRYPFTSKKFKLINQIQAQHTMYIYHKHR